MVRSHTVLAAVNVVVPTVAVIWKLNALAALSAPLLIVQTTAAVLAISTMGLPVVVKPVIVPVLNMVATVDE